MSAASRHSAQRRGTARAAPATTPVRPRVSCLICTSPRTGSWLLADQLLQTGVAGRPEEYLRPDWYEFYADHGSLGQRHMESHDSLAEELEPRRAASMPPRSFEEFLHAVRNVATTPNGVLAAKIHWRQLTRVLPVLRSSAGNAGVTAAELVARMFPNPRYVFLFRRDKVRQAISLYRAYKTDIWWLYEGDGSPLERLDDFDYREVEHLRSQLEEDDRQWLNLFREAAIEPLRIAYEDLSDRPEETTEQVLDFIGAGDLSKRPFKPRLWRQADSTTDELVQSYWVERRSGTLRVADSNGHPATRPAQRSRAALVVVDNFYADPAAVREYALRQEYYRPYEAWDGAPATQASRTWLTSCFRPAAECPFKASEELVRRLEDLVQETIDIDYWRANFPLDEQGRPRADHSLIANRGAVWNCSFHCKLEQYPGDGIHNHVIDSWNSVGTSGWAGVVFLNLESGRHGGGLKTWMNHDVAKELHWMTPIENWDLVDDLGSVPNRLILWRGNIPHAGGAGWGQDLRSGRLCQTFYFKTLNQALLKSVSVRF